MKKIQLLLILVLPLLYIAGCGESSVVAKAKPKALPDSNSIGAKILKDKCSNCHGAPHPTDHVAEHWPNVIERMQTHRIRKAYQPLSDEDKQALVAYLQEHAAK